MWLHYVNTFILNIFITIGACISEEVNRVMKTLPGVSGTFTHMSSPSSPNLSFTTKRKKKSPSSNKLRKSEHFQKKLIVFRYMGKDVRVFTKRDDYVLATGLLPEISLDCPEYRVRDEILSTLHSANNKFRDIDRCDFEFLDVSGKKVAIPLVKEGQEFTGSVVKELAGRGPVYIRLTKPPSKDVIHISDDESPENPLLSSDSDSSFDLPPVVFPRTQSDALESSSHIVGTSSDVCVPTQGTSSHVHGVSPIAPGTSSHAHGFLPTSGTSSQSHTRGVVPTPGTSSHTHGVPPVTSSHTRGVPPATSSHTHGVPPATSSHTRGVPPATSSHTRGVPPATSSHTRGVPPVASSHTRGVPPATSSHTRGVPPVTSSHTRGVSPATSSHTHGVPPATSSHTHGVPPVTSSHTRESLLLLVPILMESLLLLDHILMESLLLPQKLVLLLMEF